MSHKRCTSCGQELPFNSFAPSKQGRFGLKSECRECTKKRDAKYRALQRDRLREYKREWRATSPKAHNEILYRQENAVSARNRASTWQKDNPHKAGARNARRRAAKLQAVPSWADSAKIEQIYADAKRLTQETREAWHVDHIVPLQSKVVCGLHWEANLQVLPGIENCSKKNRHWPDMP